MTSGVCYVYYDDYTLSDSSDYPTTTITITSTVATVTLTR